MSSDWTPWKLEDALEALIDYRGKTPVKTTSGVPLVTAKIIKNGRIERPTEFIAASGYDAWMRRGIPKQGDVVLTVEAPLGEVAQLGAGKIALAQRVVTLRGKPGILDSTYLLYLLQSDELQEKLKARASGSTVIGIKQRELRKVLLQLPNEDHQKKVAKLLKSLDNSIDNLQRQNTALESIAQTLFRSWFVDFDPVHAKAAGTSPEAMSAELAGLFPSEFEESELGLIPKGWTVASFGGCLTHTIGGDWGKDVPDEKHIKAVRIIRGTDMPDLLRSDSKTVPARFVQLSKLGQRKLAPYDLVVEVSGGSRDQSTGRALMVTQTMLSELGGVAVPASFCRLFRPRSPELGVILGRRLAWHYKEGNMWGYQVQSTGIANFQTNYFLTNDKMALPPEALQAKFMEIVGPMLQSSCNPVIRALEQLRDHLLPRLISGKLRLETAEAAVAAITSGLEAEPA